jgi:N-acetyl-anhydromuramyl-L-alanine amidase AmpD
LIPGKLSDDALEQFQGIMGHYHVQSNKVDPGPAMQWDKLVEEARGLLRPEAPAILDKPATRLMQKRR